MQFNNIIILTVPKSSNTFLFKAANSTGYFTKHDFFYILIRHRIGFYNRSNRQHGIFYYCNIINSHIYED